MNKEHHSSFCHPEDLGKPVPLCTHATSVCMPTWADNVDYEEGELRVLDQLACGYPRFVYHPLVTELFRDSEKRFGNDQKSVAFPSLRIAKECHDFIQRLGYTSQIYPYEIHSIYSVLFPCEASAVAAEFWQHTGLGISSRQAQSALNKKVLKTDSQEEKNLLKKRIAKLFPCDPEEVFLYPSGMAAMYSVYQMLRQTFPQRKSVQFGFPYVDSVKVQEKFGVGHYFFPEGDNEELLALENLLQEQNGEIMAIFCEFPTNPLMISTDIEKLSALTRSHGIPLVIDNTLGMYNVDISPFADIVVSSLTKFFSGYGNVMGGSVIVRRTSPHFSSLITSYCDTLWCEDAVVLEENSRNFAERMKIINRNAEYISSFLQGHPAVEKVFYPTCTTQETYRKHKKNRGGFGGLLSLLLCNAQDNAPRFFDALHFAKGPSFGMDFSLACPYTQLAHYEELAFAEEHGVSPYLIRISVGLEPYNDIKTKLKNAFRAL